MSFTNQASYLNGPKVKPLTVRPAQYTKPRAGELVIRTHAVAVNPVDRMKQEIGNMLYGWLKYPAILGMDVAGEVVEVGSSITRFKPGDRVLGNAAGMAEKHNEHAQCGFQSYVVLMEYMTSEIPDSMPYEKAVVVPLGASTAACAMFQKDALGMNYPNLNPKPTGKTMLVWGGSTSVGCNAIQLAKAAGYDVISTSSPRNFSLLKTLGASQVFDYNSKTVIKDVVQAFQGKTIAGALAMGKGSAAATMEVVSQCQGNKAVSIATFPLPDDLSQGFLVPRLMYNVATTLVVPFAKAYFKGVKVKPVVGDTLMENEVGKLIYQDYLPQALATGAFVPTPEPVVVGHGLENIQKAFDTLGKGVSAKKVVVTL